MANEKKNQPAAKAVVAFRGYVRRDLQNEEDVDSFHQYEKGVDDASLLVNLVGAVEQGYKISLKIDGKGNKVEMFNVAGPEETRGYILSAYGSTTRKALAAIFFKHYELLEEAWGEYINIEAPEVR